MLTAYIAIIKQTLLQMWYIAHVRVVVSTDIGVRTRHIVTNLINDNKKYYFDTYIGIFA